MLFVVSCLAVCFLIYIFSDVRFAFISPCLSELLAQWEKRGYIWRLVGSTNRFASEEHKTEHLFLGGRGGFPEPEVSRSRSSEVPRSRRSRSLDRHNATDIFRPISEPISEPLSEPNQNPFRISFRTHAEGPVGRKWEVCGRRWRSDARSEFFSRACSIQDFAHHVLP